MYNMGGRIEIDIVIYPEGKGVDKVYSISSNASLNRFFAYSIVEPCVATLGICIELMLYTLSSPFPSG